MKKAIGFLEFKSIAKGIEATDVALKAGSVELLQSLPLCPGKYVTLIAGEIGAVENAVKAGANNAPYDLVDEFVLPNVHSGVFPALCGTSQPGELKALGVIETMSAAAAIVAGDAAAKAASVELLEIRLARGLGGKAFVLITGEVAAVNTAVKGAENILAEEGTLISTAVIPAPQKHLLETIM